MFVFNRSAAAVLLPLALLVAVVLWSGRSASPVPDTARAAPEATTVAPTTVARNQATRAPRR
jgi:hypothetical protein